MSKSSELRLAVVGAARGGCFTRNAVAVGGTRLAAVCDLREEALAPWRADRSVLVFDDYAALLRDDRVDAVVLATPAHLHAGQALAALAAGKHVLSEVPAAYTLDECAALVAAVDRSGLTYMLAENYCFRRDCLMVEEMVRRGVFGDLVAAEGHYLHDCRDLYFDAQGGLTWRGEFGRERSGNTYPTHSLGPVGRWLDASGGDRFARLSAWGSRGLSCADYARRAFGPDHPFADRAGWKHNNRVTTVLASARDVVVTHHLDATSPRPHHMAMYMLQGTSAAFASTVEAEREPLVWIDGRSPGSPRGVAASWEPLFAYAADFEHPLWREHGAKAANAGQGGGDWYVLREFVAALRERRRPMIDVRAAAVWSSVAPLSIASMTAGNAAVAVPTFAAAAAAGR
jgi:hypothetical protein